LEREEEEEEEEEDATEQIEPSADQDKNFQTQLSRTPQGTP
jgi:hypothetical protein